ncbi:MAG: hypothetical protein ACI36W_03170 [Coriobacteriales bacterium]
MRLSIEHIAVERTGISFELRCVPANARVTPRQAQQALELLPNLGRHVCVNDKGDCFADDIVGTEPAHLFEHVAIELMARERGSGEGLMGHSSFTGEPGLMAVRLSYMDDLEALACAQRALELVNGLD